MEVGNPDTFRNFLPVVDQPSCQSGDVQGLTQRLLWSETGLASYVQINLSKRDLARSSLTQLHISLTWYAQGDVKESTEYTEPPEPAATTHAIDHNDDASIQRPFMMTLSILCPIENSQQQVHTCFDVYAAHLAVQLDLEGVYGPQDSQNLPDDLHCVSMTAADDDTTFVGPLYCYCNARYTQDARNQVGKTDPSSQSAYPCYVKADSSEARYLYLAEHRCSHCAFGESTSYLYRG